MSRGRCGREIPDAPTIALVWKKAREQPPPPQKTVFLFAEPLNPWEGKRHQKKQGKSEKKKQGNPKKQGLEGRGMIIVRLQRPAAVVTASPLRFGGSKDQNRWRTRFVFATGEVQNPAISATEWLRARSRPPWSP